MKPNFKHRSIVALTAISLTFGAAPLRAEIDGETVAGALVLLGAAALAHNEHHYRDNYKPANAQETADFDRGFRDGLHNAAYDSRRSSAAYGQGYDAGHAERANRLSHRETETHGNKVPHAALNGCAKAVARNFAVGPHHVHITKTVVRGSNDYLVEASVGHKYMTCVMNDGADPVDAYGGRMQ